ncbi:hypothetical protein ABZX30_37495, partial [Streptomyces sp. NPDC004542]
MPRDEVQNLLAVLTGPQASGAWTDESVADALAEAGLSLEKDRYPHLRHLYIAAVVQETVDWLQQHGPDTAAEAWWLSRVRDLFVQQGTGVTAEPGPVSLLGQEYPVDLHGWLQSVTAGRTALTPQTLQALERTGYTTQGSERLRAAEEAQDDKAGKSGLTVGEVVDHLRRFYQHNRHAKADRLPGSDWTVSAGGRDIYLGRWLGAISRGRVAVAPPTFARLREAGLPEADEILFLPPTPARRRAVDLFHAARALRHHYENNPSAQEQLPSDRALLQGAGAPDVHGAWFRSVYNGHTRVSVEGVEALIAAGLPTTGDQPSAIRRTVSAQALQALRDHYAHQGQQPDAPVQDPPADTEFIDASGTSRSLNAYIGHLRTHGVQLPKGHGLPDKVVTHLQLGAYTRRKAIDPFHAARALRHYYDNNPSAQEELPRDRALLQGAGAPDVPGAWFRSVYNGATGVSVEGVEALIAAGLPTTGDQPSAIRRTVSAQALQALRNHYAHQGQQPDAPIQDPPADTEFIDASGTTRSLTQYIGHLRTHGVQLPNGHRLPDEVVTHLQLGAYTRRKAIDPFHAARALRHYYDNNPSAQEELPPDRALLQGAGAPDVPGAWFRSVYNGNTGVSVEGVEALIAAGLPTTAGNQPSAIRRTVSAQALQALRDHYTPQGQEPDVPVQDPPADTEFIDASGTSRSLNAYIGLLRAHGVQLPDGHGLPDRVVTHLQLSTPTPIRRAGVDPFHAARALSDYYRNNPGSQGELPSDSTLLKGAGAPTVNGRWFRNVYNGHTRVSVEGVEALIAAGLPTTGDQPSAIRRTVSAQALQALRNHYIHQGQEPDVPVHDPPADTEFIDASGTSRSLNAYIGLLRTHGVQLPDGHGLPDEVVTHLQLSTPTRTRRPGIDPFHAARALGHYYDKNPRAQGHFPSHEALLKGAGAPDVPGIWFRNVYNGNTGVSVEGAEALIAAGLPTTAGNQPSAIRRTVSAQALQALRDHYAHQGQEPDVPVHDPPADTEFIDASGTSRSLTQYIGLLRTHGVQLPKGHGLPDRVVTHLQLSTPTRAVGGSTRKRKAPADSDAPAAKRKRAAGRQGASARPADPVVAGLPGTSSPSGGSFPTEGLNAPPRLASEAGNGGRSAAGDGSASGSMPYEPGAPLAGPSDQVLDSPGVGVGSWGLFDANLPDAGSTAVPPPGPEPAAVSGAGRLDPDEDLYLTVDSLLRGMGVEADRDTVEESRRRLVSGGWVFPHMTRRQLAEQIAVDVASGSRVDPARVRGGMWRSPGEGQQGHSGGWQEAPRQEVPGQESGVAERSAAGASQAWLSAPYGEPSGSWHEDPAGAGALSGGSWNGFTAPLVTDPASRAGLGAPAGSVGGLFAGLGADPVGADPSAMDWAWDPGTGGHERFGSQPAALPQEFEAGIAPQSAAAGDNPGTGGVGTGDLFGSPHAGGGEVSGVGNDEDDWEGDLFGSDGEEDGDGEENGDGDEGAVRLRRVDPAAAGVFVRGLVLPTFEVPPPPAVVWRGPRTGQEDRAAVEDVPPPVLVERVLPQDPQSGQWGRVWPGEDYFRPNGWGWRRAAQTEIVPADEVPGLLAVLTGPQASGTWTDESVADALAEAGLSLEKDRYPHLRHLYIAAVVQETVDWLQQ